MQGPSAPTATNGEEQEEGPSKAPTTQHTEQVTTTGRAVEADEGAQTAGGRGATGVINKDEAGGERGARLTL